MILNAPLMFPVDSGCCNFIKNDDPWQQSYTITEYTIRATRAIENGYCVSSHSLGTANTPLACAGQSEFVTSQEGPVFLRQRGRNGMFQSKCFIQEPVS